MAINKVTLDMIDATNVSNGQVLQYDSATGKFVGATAGSGPRINTQTANTSSGTNTYNLTFPWVIGQCYIEYLNNTVTNNNTAQVVASGWVNMRSYSGNKTANVSGRYSTPCGIVNNSGTIQIPYFVCDRGTNGTVLTLNKCTTTSAQSTPWVVTGGLTTFTDNSWQNNYSLRVTAIEDIQS